MCAPAFDFLLSMSNNDDAAPAPAPTQANQIALFQATTPDGMQLAVPKVSQAMQNLMLQLFTTEQLRRPRDDFEMVADPAFMDKLTTVAAIFEVLPFRYQSGKHTLFPQEMFYNMFTRGLAKLTIEPDDEDIDGVFDIRRWYDARLPADIVERSVAAEKDPILMQQLVQNGGETQVDWTTELQALEARIPGVMALLASTLTAEQQFIDKMREQKTRALASLPNGPIGGMGGMGPGGSRGGLRAARFR